MIIELFVPVLYEPMLLMLLRRFGKKCHVPWSIIVVVAVSWVGRVARHHMVADECAIACPSHVVSVNVIFRY